MTAIVNEYRVRHAHDTQRFYIVFDDGNEAEMEYFKGVDGDLIVTHTYVPVDRRGLGAANALAARAVEYARNSKIVIVGWCAFMDAYLRKQQRSKS